MKYLWTTKKWAFVIGHVVKMNLYFDIAGHDQIHTFSFVEEHLILRRYALTLSAPYLKLPSARRYRINIFTKRNKLIKDNIYYFRYLYDNGKRLSP